MTSKQEERNERKKKKLAALAQLCSLNDEDRRQVSEKKNVFGASAEGEKQGDATDEDGFIKVTYKKKNSNHHTPPSKLQLDSHEYEPHRKRVKLEVDNLNSDDGSATDTGNSSTGSVPPDMQQMKVSLSEEQYKELRRQLRERKRQMEKIPVLHLREFGKRALLKVPEDQRTPIFLTDIQHLLMAALIGKASPCTPDRWCFLEKPLDLSHSVVLILEGLSLYHYLSNESKFEETNKIFETRLELVLPPRKENMIIEEMAQVPLTSVQADKLIEKHGSLELAVEMNKDPLLLVMSIFPIEKEKAARTETNLPTTDKFPRTKLLLSALQMVEEGYPMPLRGELSGRYKDFVFTNDMYKPVTDHSPMFGVDCEMCRTAIGFNELTRISIVNENLETVYETLVMPDNKILDYLTVYSGITPEIMKTVTKKIDDVHRAVRELLPPDAILVGQSLNSDLSAMKMMHPYVIDTSVCFNISGVRRRKSKLSKLAMTFLKEVIQENADGHDSVEDSVASIKLVKMKLENSLEFGDEILEQKKRFHDIIRLASGDTVKQNLFAHVSKRNKSTAIITAGALQDQIRDIISKASEVLPEQKNKFKGVSLFELDSNKEAIKKTREIALEHSLTITNLQLTTAQLQMDCAEKTFEKLDKWISKLWKSVAHNGMFLVLMGGSSECSSGVAKIAIKKGIANVAVDVPIKV